MGTIHTIEGNTSAGSTLVANGGCVAEKAYSTNYGRIAEIWFPKYKEGEATKVVEEARKWLGYLEKKSNKNLESFTLNAGNKNYNYFASKMKEWKVYNLQAQPWCDIFVDFVFIQALGIDRARQLLGGFSAYTPTSASQLKTAGATYQTAAKASPGAVIFFRNSTRICHTGIVDGEIVTNEEPSIESYTKEDLIEEVCKILGVNTPQKALKKTVTLSTKKNKNHALVIPVQKYLKQIGMYKGTVDRDFGMLTSIAVNEYQRVILGYKNLDSEITARNKMWKSLLGLI